MTASIPTNDSTAPANATNTRQTTAEQPGKVGSDVGRWSLLVDVPYVSGVRWLEIRRHSLTKKGTARGRGSHLSARGVALARVVGAELGGFGYVVTSASPRAIETAVAMGYAVDNAIEMPSGYVTGEVGHHDQWRWPQPYVTYAQLIRDGDGLAAVAQAHRDLWTEALKAVPSWSPTAAASNRRW